MLIGSGNTDFKSQREDKDKQDIDFKGQTTKKSRDLKMFLKSIMGN